MEPSNRAVQEARGMGLANLSFDDLGEEGAQDPTVFACVCRLVDFERALAAGKLVRVGDPQDGQGKGLRLCDGAAYDRFVKALRDLGQSLGSHALFQGLDVNETEAHGPPIVDVSWGAKDFHPTQEAADAWARQARDEMGAWLHGHGVEHAFFEMAQECSSDDVEAYYDQVRALGVAWSQRDALRGQMLGSDAPSKPGGMRV